MTTTYDIYYVAYLLCRGYEIKDSPRDDRGRLSFLLDVDEEESQSIYREWLMGISTVSAYEYANKIKSVKALVHHSARG